MTEETFERVARTYGDMLYRVAYHALKNRADAEDVTQTVFLKVLERRPDLEPGKERAWLFRVAVSGCRGLWRRLKLRRTEPLEEALAVAAPQEEPVLRQVMELKAGEREILYLIYYEGFSTRETASLLGISQTAVTTRRQRARKKLSERLEEEGRQTKFNRGRGRLREQMIQKRRQEERSRRVDEAIRRHQQSRREAAATLEQKGKRTKAKRGHRNNG